MWPESWHGLSRVVLRALKTLQREQKFPQDTKYLQGENLFYGYAYANSYNYKFISSHVFVAFGCTITCESKKQLTVALSTEAVQ